MSTSMNRRNWLKSTAVLASGMAISPSIMNAGHATYKTPTNSRIWERNLRFPPDITKLKARLLANENPYGPSERTRLAIMESVQMGNRYGHMDAAKLKGMLAELEGVTPDHIMLGPGSSDLLEKTAMITCMNGGNVVSADPAYMSLIKTALSFDAEWRPVPLTSDWAHDLDGMKDAVDKDTKLVYICNPNNPTGSVTDTDKLRAFCDEVSEKVPVFVDEAYMEYRMEGRKTSMVDMIPSGKNIIVCRTFSKVHGMAGLRVGYIVAQPETLEMIRSMVRSNMGMSITSLKGAIASLDDTSFHTMTRDLTKECREYLAGELTSMGITYIPSTTSFMMFPLQMDGEAYLEQMFKGGVGVRLFEIDGKPWSRVSMGTMDEMKLFTKTLKTVIG
ncbi:MAG: histidinol-phosphate transaminase [Bacteroidota bacterium]